MNTLCDHIEQHIPYLHNYARALTHNSVAADDLLQECLTRALIKQHLYQEGTNLCAWLSTIMHNLHINELRRRGRAEIPFDPQTTIPMTATGPTQEAHVMLSAARQAMEMLPDDQRLALELVGVEGLSYEEASHQLGLPVGTVKSRVSRGRRSLQVLFETPRVRRRPPLSRTAQRMATAA